MGFFRRFRSSSTTSISSAAQLPPPQAPPKSHPSLPPTSPTQTLPSRPALPPSSPSVSSVTSKASRNPWRKGKGKEVDPYPPLPGSTSTPILSSTSFNQGEFGQDGKRATMIYTGPGLGSGPAGGKAQIPTSPKRDGPVSPKRDKRRMGSMNGGFLGRLGFEMDQKDQPSAANDPVHSGQAVSEELDTGYGEEALHSAATLVDPSPLDIAPMFDNSPPASHHDHDPISRGHGMTSELDLSRIRLDDPGEEELLDSPEKRNKFWKGKGRARRASRSASDYADDRSGSPTPRKPNPPPSAIEPASPFEIHHPRPQALRRPSSSIFNFARSISRASGAVPEFEVQPGTDDGSFQVKGFRHISGISDVEGTGGLEGYLTHMKRDSTARLVQQAGNITPGGSPVAGNPASNLPRPPISRPPSIAHSLASVDDAITSTNKVSVAAFRKGIRRPSEGPIIVMSESGHGTRDDDDLPLAIFRRTPHLSRGQSALSLSSMRSEDWEDRQKPVYQAVSSTRPSPSATPSPEPRAVSAVLVQLERDVTPSNSMPPKLVVQRQTHQRNGGGSGGFIVKSRMPRPTSTDVGTPQPVVSRSVPRELLPALASSATSSVSNSPDEQAATNRTTTFTSPTEIDGYFSSAAPVQTSVQHEAGGPLVQLDMNKATPRDLLSPSSPTARRQAPSVRSLRLPQPGDKTPGSISDLPLPPDQMPDTPPEPRKELALPLADVEISPKPASRIRTTSILDEPLKILSELWSPARTSREYDQFDPAFVAKSMEVLGGDERSPTPSRKDSPEPAQSSPADRSDTRQPSSVERSRPPIHARLASAAASAMPKPTLTKLKMGDDESADGHATERNPMSPISDSGTVSPIARQIPAASRFERPSRHRASTSSVSKTKTAAWSSSEDESDDEREKRPVVVSPRRVPGGPRKQSLRQPMSSVSKKASKRSSKHSKVDAESSEDESLSVIKSKASQQSSARPSPSLTASPLPSPSQGFRSSRRSSLANEMNLDTDSEKPNEQNRPSAMRSSALSLPPGGFAHSLHHTSASTASSTSGMTSSSAGQHPLTPKEMPKAIPAFQPRKSGLGHSRDTSRDGAVPWNASTSMVNLNDPVPPSAHPDERHRHSSTGQVPAWQPYSPAPFDPGHMGMPQSPMGMGVPSHMNPIAMRQYQMKQAWQAQFMAAAYRASEDEWERASSVTNDTMPSSAGPVYGQPFSPMPMGMPPFPMYGYPSPNHLQQMPFPPYPYPPAGFPLHQPQPGGGGMYSYGTGSHSVFGGDFGPPSMMPSQLHYNPDARQDSGFYFGRNYDSQSVTGGGREPSPVRPKHRKMASGNSSPPSSRRKSGGDWEGIPTPRSKQRQQSQSQFAN